MSKSDERSKLAEELSGLVREFGAGYEPQYARLARLTREVRETNRELERSIDTLRETLDYLRICVKYQRFDLEATRRENEQLRKLLDGN